MSLELGPSFQCEAGYLGKLRSHRDSLNDRRVSLGVGFLDDCLGGLYPDDFILIGAGTGVGKTGLAVQLAWHAVGAGLNPVCLFALEAEPGEVAARLAFAELGKVSKHPSLDFSGWWRGQWNDLERRCWPEVEQTLAPKLAALRTLYKVRGDFTPKDLAKQLEAIAETAKMVVVDHLHVVDRGNDREMEAQLRTMNLLRDFVLTRNIPVVAFSHLRKSSPEERGVIMPDVADLRGSGELGNKATGVILVARDWDGERTEKHLSPTLFRVGKDRRGRSSTMVARCNYDMSSGTYEEQYTLGRIVWENRKQQWQPIDPKYTPYWAKRSVQADSRPPF